MNRDLFCLVMAGGKGTRFWPESTSQKPKQYLSLLGKKSLLAETLDRFDGLIPADKRFVVTVKEQESLVRKSSEDKINSNGVIFEPSGRNTAPCILLSLAHLVANGVDQNSVVSVVPSDHVILNAKGFCDTVKSASELSVKNNSIVTIGITPHFPHTGYGYIQKGDEQGAGFSVKEFKEKPDLETATEYLKSGNYFWNAGMFVAPIFVFLEAFKIHAPEMFSYFEKLKQNIQDFDKVSSIYELLPKDSIDYAIMEKTKKIDVVAGQFDWNDLGSWDALQSVIEKTDGNTAVSTNGHFFFDSKDNIVHTPGKFTALVGVDDLVVVSNSNAVLVMPKSRSQDVKKVVEFLNDKNLKELI